MLITVAPLSAAYSIALARSDELPEPELWSIFMGIILEFHATPQIPIPLFPSAAAIPATWVPWELSSLGSLSLLM